MLQQYEAQFGNLYEHAPIGAALVDAEGRCLVTNSCLQRILGYDEDELRRMTFAEFTHPDDVDAFVMPPSPQFTNQRPLGD